MDISHLKVEWRIIVISIGFAKLSGLPLNFFCYLAVVGCASDANRIAFGTHRFGQTVSAKEKSHCVIPDHHVIKVGQILFYDGGCLMGDGDLPFHSLIWTLGLL